MTTTMQRHPHCPFCHERNAALVASGAHILGCTRCYEPRMVQGQRVVKPATQGYSLRAA